MCDSVRLLFFFFFFGITAKGGNWGHTRRCTYTSVLYTFLLTGSVLRCALVLALPALAAGK
jgi:hypothetical protein